MRRTVKLARFLFKEGDEIAEIYDTETRADVAQYFGGFYYRR